MLFKVYAYHRAQTGCEVHSAAYPLGSGDKTAVT